MESLKEIRQQLTYADDRAGNSIEEQQAQRDHIRKALENLTAHIEAGTPEPSDPDPPEGEDPIDPEDPGSDPENETPEIPGPETPGLIVGEDFESYEDGNQLNGSQGPPGSIYRWIGETHQTRVSTRYAYSGQKSLLFDYPGTAPEKDSIREQRFDIAPTPAEAPSELGIQFMIRVPDNWWFRDPPVGSSNNKLLALWGESYGGGPYTEPKIVWEWGWGGGGDGNARLWMGTNERGPSGGRLEPRKGGRQNTEKAGIIFDTSMRGQWIRLRFHVKVAIAGRVDAWRDDELISRAPADWRTLPWHGVINYIRRGYLMGWSNAGFDEPTAFAIDDLVIHRGEPPWLGEMK